MLKERPVAMWRAGIVRLRALRFGGSADLCGGKIFVAWSAAEAPPFLKKERDEGGGTKIFL
jgi:hypothetical protein